MVFLTTNCIMEDFDLWEINLLRSLEDLSDLEMQKLSWSGNHPEIVFSFTEALAAVYDDFDFEEYIVRYKSIHGEDGYYALLVELDTRLEAFQKDGYRMEESGGYQEILNDVRWKQITEIAKKITDAFRKGLAQQG